MSLVLKLISATVVLLCVAFVANISYTFGVRDAVHEHWEGKPISPDAGLSSLTYNHAVIAERLSSRCRPTRPLAKDRSHIIGMSDEIALQRDVLTLAEAAKYLMCINVTEPQRLCDREARTQLLADYEHYRRLRNDVTIDVAIFANPNPREQLYRDLSRVTGGASTDWKETLQKIDTSLEETFVLSAERGLISASDFGWFSSSPLAKRLRDVKATENTCG